MKYYTFFSLIMAGLATLTTKDKFGGRRGNIYVVLYENAASGIFVTIYMIFAIFSCAYSYRMTTRPGMSSEIRKDFISRHI